MRNCPDCHAVVGDTAKFCDNCGYPLQQSQSATPPASPPAAEAWSPFSPPSPAMPAARDALGLCSACGFKNLPGEMFCQNCGVQLPPIASTPPPPPRPMTGPREPEAPASPAAPDRCPECGSQVAPRDVFCLNCGVQIRRSTPVAEPPKLAPSAQPPKSPDIEPPPQAPKPAEPKPAPIEAAGSESTVVEGPSPFAPVPAIPEPLTGRLIVRLSGAEIKISSDQNEIVIGRSDPVRDIYPEIDLTPHGGDNQGVSRRHARLVRRPDGLYLEDLNSTNYTFLNRQRLLPGQHYQIKDGDEIRVGLLILDYRQP